MTWQAVFNEALPEFGLDANISDYKTLYTPSTAPIEIFLDHPQLFQPPSIFPLGGTYTPQVYEGDMSRNYRAMPTGVVILFVPVYVR